MYTCAKPMQASLFLMISSIVIPSAHHCLSIGTRRYGWVNHSTRKSARHSNGDGFRDDINYRSSAGVQYSGIECVDSADPNLLQNSRHELRLMGETLVTILANDVDSEKAVSKAMKRHRNDLLNSNERRAKFAAVVLGTSVQRRRLSFLLDGSDSGADGRAQGGTMMFNNTDAAGSSKSKQRTEVLDKAVIQRRSPHCQMRAESLLLLFQFDALLKSAEQANEYASKEGSAAAVTTAVSSAAASLFLASSSSLPSAPLPVLPWAWNPYPARRKVLLKRAKRNLEKLHIHSQEQEQFYDANSITSGDATEPAAAAAASSFWLGVEFSLPPWLAAAWVAQYGLTNARLLALSSNVPGLVCLRRNRARCASLTDLRANIMADLDSIQSAASTVQSASLLSSSLFSSSEEQADPLEHVDTLITSLAGAANGWETGLVLSQRPPTVLGLSSWQKGLFEVMDQGSQFIAAAVEASPGEVILDLCAGNGGKTLALASAMHSNNPHTSASAPLIEDCKSRNDYNIGGDCDNGIGASETSNSRGVGGGGRVICFDVSSDRLKQLRGSLDRAGVNLAAPFSASLATSRSEEGVSVHICWPSSSSSSPAIGKRDVFSQSFAPGLDFQMLSDEAVPANSVDAALVDVPCSSSGVLRRRPSLRWGMMNPNIIESDEEPEAKGGERRGEIVIEDVEKAPPPATTGSLPSLQRALLLRAASAVKPGGRLVYATCSVFAAENEEVASWFEEQEAFISGNWEPWPFPDNTANFVNAHATGHHEPGRGRPHPQPMSGDGNGKPQQSVSSDDGVNHVMPGHWRALLPHVHGTDGFFVARWKRRVELNF